MISLYRKISIVVLLLLAISAGVSAKPRSLQQMKAAAQKVINASYVKKGNKAPRKDTPTLLQERSGLAVMGYSEGGYAIVSTDDLLPEVLGYADSKFDKDSKNEGFNWWMKAINDVATYAIKHNIQNKAQKFETHVDPLLTTKWGQMEPYNNYCPNGTSSGDDWQNFENAGKCVSGCIATAMAQIMNYHRYPLTGTGNGSVTVQQSDGTKIEDFVDFTEGVFDWNNMKDDYTESYSEEEAAAVAKLLHNVGVASRMSYATDGSGTSLYNAYEALVNNFGYPENEIGGLTRDYISYYGYTDQDWLNTVYDELDNHRPIFYTGVDEVGGHAFVLDGYNEDGLVHVNWGWDGRDDGYFDINLLNPETYQFTGYQQMLFNIYSPNAKKADYIEVENEAGSLQDIIELTEETTYEGLKVKGEINSSDLKVIRYMAGRDEKGNPTGCHLKSLDISEARIVNGGEAYLVADNTSYTTEDDILPYKALYNCHELESLSLPYLKDIKEGAWAFTSLKELNLTNTESESFVYDDGMLYSANGKELRSIAPIKTGEVVVAEGVERISDYAIAGCHHITALTLPESISNIGNRGIFDCGNLASITSPTAVAAPAGDRCFMSLFKDCTLYYPAGSRANYEQALWWKAFFTSDNMKHQEYATEEPDAISTLEADKQTAAEVYTIDGRMVKGNANINSSLQKGIYIVKQKDSNNVKKIRIAK